MPSMFRLFAGSLLALALITFSAASRAQTLLISFDGSVTNCSDISLNGPVTFDISATGQQSGADTLLDVSLGGSALENDDHAPPPLGWVPLRAPLPLQVLQGV